ncbi:MAG: TRAP transporter small permease [Bacillota bacterium]
MQLFEAMVTKFSRAIDFIAGIILAGTVLLIVVNILLRALLDSSILGTYEMVGFFTAAVIGLSLARCAIENGHIAVGIFVERLPEKARRAVGFLAGIPILVFLGFITYNLAAYGVRIAATGAVSSTIQLAYYPFIYLVALGFMMLTLTMFLKIVRLARGGEQW